jgi:cytochrome c peroxidase
MCAWGLEDYQSWKYRQTGVVRLRIPIDSGSGKTRVRQNTKKEEENMKRSKVLVLLVAVAVTGIIALPLINLAVGLPGNVQLGATGSGSESYQMATTALAKKCGNCHTADGKIPFYASFPIARGIIQEDIRKGTEYVNLSAEFSAAPQKAVNEAVLAKVEYTVEYETMPPMKYLLLHWNGSLSGTEESNILKWIKEERQQFYAEKRLPAELARQVVRPLPAVPQLNQSQVALGEKLYHDTRLSKDNSISCNSCHDLAKGGVDGEQFSSGVNEARGDINGPTVYNAALNIAQFWDGRAEDLQAQADGPPTNPIEMASNWEEISGKLNQDEALKKEFEEVYPEGFSGDTITHSIAEFEKTLLTPNSAFDRYLQGEESALSDNAQTGYQLFLDTTCATCHVGPAFGGQSYEKMGRARDYFKMRGNLAKADSGRFNFTKKEQDRYKFKVPTLRNIALTQPYFHDGTVKALDAAVKLMAEYQVGVSFSPEETGLLVDFLKSLTGEYKGKILK